MTTLSTLNAPVNPNSGRYIFDSIIKAADADPNAIIKYEIAPAQVTSMKMKNHFHPLSITPGEFEYLRDFIITHNLKRGYECATAFGISGLAAAMGFKQTGGKFVTMDAYIEEKHDISTAYRNIKDVNDNDPDGLKSVRWLISHFGLEDVYFPTIGWSPDNVAENIISVHGFEKIDYAFIDAGHWDEMAHNDATAVLPFIDTSKPFAVFFHDVPCFTPAMWQSLESLYGYPMQVINTIAETWLMGVITNIKY